MSIVVAGFHIHRAQITFDALDTETGEVSAGRIPSSPEAVARWVERYPGREVHVALEAGTGWYFVARALERSDSVPHLAEVAEEPGAARPQAPGKDRPRRRALAADVAAGRPAARSLDPDPTTSATCA